MLNIQLNYFPKSLFYCVNFSYVAGAALDIPHEKFQIPSIATTKSPLHPSKW